jgi:hypothetical protein
VRCFANGQIPVESWSSMTTRRYLKQPLKFAAGLCGRISKSHLPEDDCCGCEGGLESRSLEVSRCGNIEAQAGTRETFLGGTVGRVLERIPRQHRKALVVSCLASASHNDFIEVSQLGS